MPDEPIARRSTPYSPAELADLHGVTESIIRKRCREGKLPFFRLGKFYRFTPEVAHSEETRRSLHAVSKDSPTSFYRRAVYFVGSDLGPIKIGMAEDVQKRLASIQACSPSPLTLLATCGGGIKQERIYHKRFATHRLHGEWFEPHDDILAEVERLKAA